jgi:hypothetical protein
MTVSLNHTLQILHIKSSLHRCTLVTNTFLHNSQRNAVSSPTENSSRLSPVENSLRTPRKRASVSPIKPWYDTRKNKALLLLRYCGTRGDHVTSPHSCIFQAFTVSPSNERGVTLQDTAELGSARRKNSFVYCCVIEGTCFHVTVFAWRKYTTIYGTIVQVNPTTCLGGVS